MVWLILDPLKAKKCVNMQLKNYRSWDDMFLIDIRPKKCVIENGGTLKCVPDCYKNLKMWNKTVDKYTHILEFVLDCYKTQKMCNKSVNTSPSAIQFVPECYETQQMCVKNVSNDPFMLKYCPYR